MGLLVGIALSAEEWPRAVSDARLRAEGRDPSTTPEAKRKHSEATARRNRERAEWNRAHPGPHDPEVFGRQILPGLQNTPLSAMIAATALKWEHVWRIRRGDRVPHPMHWQALRGVGQFTGDA